MMSKIMKIAEGQHGKRFVYAKMFSFSKYIFAAGPDYIVTMAQSTIKRMGGLVE